MEIVVHLFNATDYKQNDVHEVIIINYHLTLWLERLITLRFEITLPLPEWNEFAQTGRTEWNYWFARKK